MWFAARKFVEGAVGLCALLARLEFLREIDLVVEVVVVVPVILTANIVPYTEEHCLVFEVGLVLQLNVKGKSVVAVIGQLLPHIVVVLCNDL